MKTPRYSRFDCNPGCAIEAAVSLLDGKWKCIVLYLLRDDTLRFSEIHRQTPDVTQRMLTTQLRVEADGLLVRTVFAQVPPRVEYSISPLGRTLLPILEALKAWGDEHITLFGERAGETRALAPSFEKDAASAAVTA